MDDPEQKNEFMEDKMREKIVELAKEVWEYGQISLEIPAQDLQIEAEAGSSVRGVFHIQNTEGRMMRGKVYIHGNTLLRLTKADFSGRDCLVTYEFCAEGLLCGEAQKCTLEVYADCGYLAVECKVQVILPYVSSSIGRLDNLMRFTELCRKDWKEALQVFQSADFERVFLQDDERMKKIYEGLLRGEGRSNALEEFLIAARRKKPVQLHAKKNHLTLFGIKQEQEEIIVLKRNTWGYGKYSVSSEGLFLRLDRNLVWADAFVGDEYSLGVMILPQYLHQGRNVGKIVLKSVTDRVEITVEVVKEFSEEQEAYFRKRRQKKGNKLQFMKGLRGFLVGFLKGTGYVNRQKNLIKEMIVPMPLDFRELCKVHFAEAEGNREDAAEMLRKLQLSGEPAMIFGEHCREDMEKGERLSGERALAYGCYLYFCVLLYRQEELDERGIYLNYLDILRKRYDEMEGLLYLYILAVLCMLPEQVAGDGKKMESLAECLLLLRSRSEKNGESCDSSFLYVLACQIWNRRPDMLVRLDRFSVPAIYTGIRYKMLSKSLKSQFIYLAGSANCYHGLTFHSLCCLYKENCSDEVLSAMLKHLIRGQQAGENYHRYFRMGVEKRLRITQLYEYFIYSMDEDDMGQLPSPVLTYFQYACSLPDKKKAALYANIISNRSNDAQTYLNYQGQMERFVLEQVTQHKISRNLSVLYGDLLNSTNMDTILEEHLAQIMFRQEVTCHQMGMKGLYVLYEELDREEYVPLNAGKALVNLVTDQAVLLFEDGNGGRHYNVDYTVDRLFRLDELYEKCMESNPDSGLLILSLLKKAGRKKSFSGAELFAMEKALGRGANSHRSTEMLDELEDMQDAPEFMGGLSETARGNLWMTLLEYYYENFNEEMLNILLEQRITVAAPFRKRLAEICISAGKMEMAYELLEKGVFMGILQQILPERLSSLVHWKLEQGEGTPEQERLIAKACYVLFKKGLADKKQMAFLLKHMEGTVGEMLVLWKSHQARTGELEKERCLLGESILIHVLFSGMELAGFQEVFTEYYKSRENFKYTEHYHLTGLVVRAYLFVYSSRFLHNQAAEEKVLFDIIFDELRHTYMITCRYALLKYYSGIPEGTSGDAAYTPEQLSWIEANAKECIEEGMVFPFFRNFPKEVKLPSGIRNACYVSYMAAPSSIVTLHYCYRNAKNEGEYETQVMKNRFQGIYVRRFLLFYDEKLMYYITEEQNGKEIVRTPEQEISEEQEPGGTENSFAQINMILAAKDMRDDVTMRKGMEHYIETEYAQKQLFTPFLRNNSI